MRSFKHLRLRQVDSALRPFHELRGGKPPEKGWARTIREALGMSIRQMAERMGVAKTTAASLERNEASGAIQLDSLRRLGEALGCDLVYALIPRESLEETVRNRTRAVAAGRVRRVSESTELEEQGIPSSERERQIMELAERLWQEMPQELWDDTL